jgi:hypothetical protein
MQRLTLIAAALTLIAPSAFAQGPAPRTAQVAAVKRNEAPTQLQTPSMANLTPEMWLYLQERDRYDDPAQAVRRKAEDRATQRNHRMAARKWFGFSNTRPTASPLPIMGSYSPFWAGNDIDPNRWNGIGPATIIETEERGAYLR